MEQLNGEHRDRQDICCGKLEPPGLPIQCKFFHSGKGKMHQAGVLWTAAREECRTSE